MSGIRDAPTNVLADTAAFIQLVTDRRSFFHSDGQIIVTRAPGRLDLMGGIADYSGALVLELPIAHATHVALQLQDEEVLDIISLPDSRHEKPRSFSLPMADLMPRGSLLEYPAARAIFERDSSRRWAAYVVGAFLVLMREKGLTFEGGARILISSSVPEGKGVSSSAALEVAVMRALDAIYSIGLAGPETAFLCQKVENLIAGAPCGVMDQMTAACGEADRLLAILCQPGELKESIPLPNDIAVWGIDSGIRHSVSGADYRTVRTAAFMGYRILAEVAGLSWHPTAVKGKVEIDDPRWNGYLANVGLEEFYGSFASTLPREISGGGFIARYGGTTDLVTAIKPEVIYPVFEATRHPIEEHHRVTEFARVLGSWNRPEDAIPLGKLMYESHASYSACGLGSRGTDELVEAVRVVGAANGLFGAKITGGGSGGTVAVLGLRNAENRVRQIAEEYAARTGRPAVVIAGSSQGAMKFGAVRVV
ncbi:MAG: galactokinase family protein [Acidobacteriota bacterium]